VKNVFVRRLDSYLQLEIGRLEISVDYQIQPGADWAANLKRRVARSKVMIPLLSADYFHRDWCRLEMALMFERERQAGLEGHNDNYGLIIPVRLGDGVRFPELIARVQHQPFDDFADPDLPQGSPRASLFNQSVQALAKYVAGTLHRAPECCDDWANFTGDAFFDLLAPKPPPPPRPPRLIV
jgi:hypothetical protein